MQGDDGRLTVSAAVLTVIAVLRVTMAYLLPRLEEFDTTAYSDSINDLAMLEHVHEPVAANPDERLLAIAREQGYECFALSVSGKWNLGANDDLRYMLSGGSGIGGFKHTHFGNACTVQGRQVSLMQVRVQGFAVFIF